MYQKNSFFISISAGISDSVANGSTNAAAAVVISVSDRRSS